MSTDTAFRSSICVVFLFFFRFLGAVHPKEKALYYDQQTFCFAGSNDEKSGTLVVAFCLGCFVYDPSACAALPSTFSILLYRFKTVFSHYYCFVTKPFVLFGV